MSVNFKYPLAVAYIVTTVIPGNVFTINFKWGKYMLKKVNRRNRKEHLKNIVINQWYFWFSELNYLDLFSNLLFH